MAEKITIQTSVHAPVEKVWDFWTNPAHITQWCNALSDWHAPTATNDLRVGGQFSTRMESKDSKEGFDFGGTYTTLEPNKKIEYTINGDNREVKIIFEPKGSGTHITETFETENINTLEKQRDGWQSILDNFKKYVEAN